MTTGTIIGIVCVLVVLLVLGFAIEVYENRKLDKEAREWFDR